LFSYFSFYIVKILLLILFQEKSIKKKKWF
jgi:hypothetical protein